MSTQLGDHPRSMATAVLILTSSLLACERREHPPTHHVARVWFQPSYRINWPGRPIEYVDVIVDNMAEKWYRAECHSMNDGQQLVFAVVIVEYSDMAFQQTSREKAIEQLVDRLPGTVVHREDTKYGLKQYPATVVKKRRGSDASQSFFFLIGTRVYQLTVSAPNEEGLKSKVVDDFLNSFELL